MQGAEFEAQQLEKEGGTLRLSKTYDEKKRGGTEEGGRCLKRVEIHGTGKGKVTTQ